MKILLTLILSALLLNSTANAAENTTVDDYEPDKITLSKPPATIGQWYKPQNERQVWLHTMFRLRREFQAIGDYAALEDQPGVKKWSQRLLKDYKSIAEMVPEWSDEVDVKWADKLLAAAEKGDYAAVTNAQRQLGKTCSSCHKEYRAVTAALYRTPDYSQVMVELEDTMEELSYDDHMKRLSRDMNRLKIALEDTHPDKAREYAKNLTAGLNDLAQSCGGCHQDNYPEQRIWGEHSQKLLSDLTAGIGTAPTADSQKLLGEAAVTICARCHAVHRTQSDLSKKMLK